MDRLIEVVRTSDPNALALRRMSQAAEAASKTWTLHELARRTAAQAGHQDYVGQLRAIYDEILKRWRYVMEPGEWVPGTASALLGQVLGLDYQGAADPTRADLRTLHEMAKLRLCTRTQGEYQRVFREMRARVIEIHPWVGEHDFLEVHCAANGTCAFPRYGKTSCGLYHPAMDLDWLKKQVKRQYWSAAPQVAVPVAKDGRTM